MKITTVTSTTTIMSIIALSIIPASAVNAEMIKVREDKARARSIAVNVEQGQPSPIVFQNGEIIDAIKLGDMSKNVFSFNAPIDSGQTTTVNINQIEEIDIPGATKASVPIIDIETIDTDGERWYYSFELHNNSAERSKIFIEPAPEPILKPSPEPLPVITTIETTYGSATPEDIELGLEVSIRDKTVKSTGNLARAVREYIAQTQNGTSSKVALANTSLPLSAIQKLAKIGQEEDTKIRLSPLKRL